MGLQQLGILHNTDKATVHGYLPIYENYLRGISNKVKNVLEIGVQKGNSLRMWRSYFPTAEIFGLDIKIDNILKHDRISLYKGDATDVKTAENFKDEMFDVIIDDASHIPSEQLLTIFWFWPKLKTGGIYFIEDIGANAILNLSGTERIDKIIKWFAPFKPEVHKIYKNNCGHDVLLAMKK